MTKYTTVALVLVTVLFVMQVPVEPCSDEFIKEMIVNVCGMVGLKRSFSDNGSYGSKLGLNFKGMLGDIEREFQHLVGDIEEADLLLKKLNKNNPRVENVTPPLRPIHLSGFRDRLRHSTIRDDAGKAVIRKREVMAEFRKCCIKKCTVKDLSNICEKK